MKKCGKIIGLIILLFTFIPLFGQNNSIGDMEGMLERHNFYRAEVGTPPLQWSNKLAKNALKWANILKKKNCLLKHSPQNMRKGYGENIAWNSGYSESAIGVVDRWCSEKEYFNFSTRTCNGSWDLCGHYTQVIWKNTSKVGCAVVKCGDEEIWVCQYSPSGNINVSNKAPAY